VGKELNTPEDQIFLSDEIIINNRGQSVTVAGIL
jgi:hypothetical protein